MRMIRSPEYPEPFTVTERVIQKGRQRVEY